MNEKLIFRFIQNGQQLPIEDLALVEFDRGGVVLDGEISAWPRGLRFDFEGVGASKDGLKEALWELPEMPQDVVVLERN
jgi:hypothetical protein